MSTLPPEPPPFRDLLGRLVRLLRASPVNEGEVLTVTVMLVTRLAQGPADLEGGIENSWAADGDPLRERLQARRIDAIRVAAGARPDELVALGRALADDTAPMPLSGAIRVTFLPDLPAAEPVPVPEESHAAPVQEPPPADRHRSGSELVEVVERALSDLEAAIRREQWHMVLHAAQAAVRMLQGLEDPGRRQLAWALRRLLNRRVLESLIEQAYRNPEEQARTVEVLQAAGAGAVDLMLGILIRNETVGPRAFLVEALAGIPEAGPYLLPMLRQSRPSEVRLAAELLGRLGVPEALPALAGVVKHPDEQARHAAIDALGRFKDKAALEALRQGLIHESPATRARAAQALAGRRTPAMAMPLLAALEAEQDPTAWEAILGALAMIDASEAAQALVGVATQRPGLFQLGAALTRRQLAVVRALAVAGTGAARQALGRIAAEAKGEVQQAADRALKTPGG